MKCLLPALALLSLQLGGCAVAVSDGMTEAEQGPTAQESPPGAGNGILELRIDEDLPLEYQEALVAGVGQWEAAGARVELSFVTEGANVIAGGCIGDGAKACAEPFEWIRFDLQAMSEASILTPGFAALHELGHFLGIERHLPEGNVMQEFAGPSAPPTVLTVSDVAALPH